MRAKQDEENELIFYVTIDGDDQFRENSSHLWDLYGSTPSPKMRKERDRRIAEYQSRYCQGSEITVSARELDSRVYFNHELGLKFALWFVDRGAAALFKLTYC